MHFGFSFVGAIFLVMLYVPNIIWSWHKPQGYEQYAEKENKILLIFERAGEVAVTALILVFKDFNPQGVDLRLLWLIAAALLLILYEIFWVRYFKSEKRMADFYRRIIGIPVAGATLPVAALLLIAVYGKNPYLFAAGIILGIGHIGIHLSHKKESASYDND